MYACVLEHKCSGLLDGQRPAPILEPTLPIPRPQGRDGTASPDFFICSVNQGQTKIIIIFFNSRSFQKAKFEFTAPQKLVT